jgi:hypothetical protein
MSRRAASRAGRLVLVAAVVLLVLWVSFTTYLYIQHLTNGATP